jgi:acid phosphatase type 7
MLRRERLFRGTGSLSFVLAAACIVSPALSQQPLTQSAEVQPAPPAPASSENADENGGPTFTVSDLPVGRPLRIVVYGDMRFTDPSNTSDTHPGVRKWLAQKVGETQPDILLLTGDMPFHGSETADWKVYDEETAGWAQQRLRIYPTIGNHGGLPDPRRGIQNYFAAYPQIDHHSWYSVQMGNIYLITLDTSTFLNTGWEQRRWLEGQLAHLPPSVDFVFLLFHVPLVSDLQTAFILNIPDAATLDLRHYLEGRAAASHAKFVVFNGHIHNYERFEMNGITHVISGGGGARPYPIFIRGDQDLYRARTYPNFNYVVITLEGKHADAKMYRVVDPDAAQKSVTVMDSFTLDAK